ncbi:MAG: hypothetical protein KF861_16920 [Planctomycetaceae bacterium]|nr:hypothetical protein [Planctomycetaceae bacterium]
MAEGSTPRGGTYVKQSQLVLFGVLDLIESRPIPWRADDPRSVVQRKIGLNADLFLATLYLCQIYYEAPGYEAEIREALEKLIDHICRAQGHDGTWGTEAWAPVLGTVLGWECLQVASSVGFEVHASARLVGEALLKELKSLPEENGNWMFNFYKNASSLRVLHSLNHRSDPIFHETVERLLKTVAYDKRPFQLAGGEEYLAFYLVTECLIQNPRPEWRSWYPRVVEGLQHVQNHDGSWTGHHCITDRTFCTAAALLTLLAMNRSLPTSDL